MGEIYVDPPDYSIINPVAAGVANLTWWCRWRTCSLSRAARRLSSRRGSSSSATCPAWPACARRAAHGHGTAGLSRGGAAVGGGLVGDAAGFYDPFTGRSLHALRGAELLAEVAHGALRGGECSRAALAPYARARRAAFRGKARLTRALQALIAPILADLAAHALARRPARSTRCWACWVIRARRRSPRRNGGRAFDSDRGCVVCNSVSDHHSLMRTETQPRQCPASPRRLDRARSAACCRRSSARPPREGERSAS